MTRAMKMQQHAIRPADYDTIARYRLAAIQEKGIEYPLLMDLLIKFFGVPQSALYRWVGGKEASFEHLHILKRVHQLTESKSIEKVRASIQKMIAEQPRKSRHYFVFDTIAANEPSYEHKIEHVNAYYEGPNDSHLTDYADKHGV